MEKALNYYKNNIKAVNEKLNKLEKVLIYFSILRFIIVILCVGIMYYFYKQSSIEAMGASFLVFLLTFIIVAFFHNERINKKKKLLIILEYNEKGIKRLDNTWREFKDIGEEFINKKHKFSNTRPRNRLRHAPLSERSRHPGYGRKYDPTRVGGPICRCHP